jgi:hypothetical protein
LGVTNLGGLLTVVLFPVDCSYAFKHVGRQMMKVAEKTKSLAKQNNTAVGKGIRLLTRLSAPMMPNPVMT